MCHGPHWLLLENLGKHYELYNVVVFLRIYQNIDTFLMIFIWVHVDEGQMHFWVLSYEYHMNFWVVL